MSAGQAIPCLLEIYWQLDCCVCRPSYSLLTGDMSTARLLCLLAKLFPVDWRYIDSYTAVSAGQAIPCLLEIYWQLDCCVCRPSYSLLTGDMSTARLLCLLAKLFPVDWRYIDSYTAVSAGQAIPCLLEIYWQLDCCVCRPSYSLLTGDILTARLLCLQARLFHVYWRYIGS